MNRWIRAIPWTVLFFVGGIVLAGPAALSTFTISSHANIYGAGLPKGASMPGPSGGGGGVAPATFAVDSGKGQVVTFTDARGTVDFGNASSPTGPDGGNFSYRVWSHRGISAFRAPVVGCLVGVFLGEDGPGTEAPDAIDFGETGLDFRSLSPELGQVFFVGDGVTSDGYRQQFHVPGGAKVLYLGFADSYYSGAGPGYYGDNSGRVTISVRVDSTELTFPEVP